MEEKELLTILDNIDKDGFENLRRLALDSDIVRNWGFTIKKSIERISQEKMAEILGINKGIWEKIENGKWEEEEKENGKKMPDWVKKDLSEKFKDIFEDPYFRKYLTKNY